MLRMSSVSKTSVATAPSLTCCGVKRTTTLIGSPVRRFIVPWLGDTEKSGSESAVKRHRYGAKVLNMFLTAISVSDVLRTPARISNVCVGSSLGSSVKAPQSSPSRRCAGSDTSCCRWEAKSFCEISLSWAPWRQTLDEIASCVLKLDRARSFCAPNTTPWPCSLLDLWMARWLNQFSNCCARTSSMRPVLRSSSVILEIISSAKPVDRPK
mmetsp:Transcript_33048/g.106897  ORF Transcript_33048/g.106897 Transcript_33048/m.106897 type:complete len:211 (-) Transcript_33048:454-1086(-)